MINAGAVIERAELNVKPGEMDSLLAHLRDTANGLSECSGFRSISFGRGIEQQDKALLLLHWESVEAHRAARDIPAFVAFVAPLLEKVEGAAAEHFAMSEWAGDGK